MRPVGEPETLQMSQRSGLASSFVNPSPLGGSERVTISTTFLAKDTLFYYLTVAPENDLAGFQDAFERVRRSIRLSSR